MMKFLECEEYFVPVAQKFFGHLPIGYGSVYGRERALADFLGLLDEFQYYYEHTDSELSPMSPELKNLLIKLNGPYGAVIMEVLRRKKKKERPAK